MEFEVTEIKMLGSGLGRSLSLRLDAVSDCMTAGSGFTKAAYTLHAVVPYSAEFGTVQVGHKFKFERIEKTLQERVVSNQIQMGSTRNFCFDSACKLKGFVDHEFGPQCRLWKRAQ